jgi:hypothetical protein
VDSKVLKDNYDNISKYGLTLNNDNVKYLLYNKKILEDLDYYIEAIGYEKGFLGKEDAFDGISYITKNPYKINDINSSVLVKLRFASENNHKIYGTKPGILSGEITNSKVDLLRIPNEYEATFFNGEYEFINHDDLLKLKYQIETNSIFDITLDEVLSKLDNLYKVNDLQYKFGNVLISRMKTIRLYNYLKRQNLSLNDTLVLALTYNSVLKIQEYQKIVEVVNNVVLGGN